MDDLIGYIEKEGMLHGLQHSFINNKNTI